MGKVTAFNDFWVVMAGKMVMVCRNQSKGVQVDAKPAKPGGPDEIKDGGKAPPLPEPATVIATTWADIVKHAETRPLTCC